MIHDSKTFQETIKAGSPNANVEALNTFIHALGQYLNEYFQAEQGDIRVEPVDGGVRGRIKIEGEYKGSFVFMLKKDS